MAKINLFGGITVEVGDDFNSSTASPRQLSEVALTAIQTNPGNFTPIAFHIWRLNKHCFLGFVDLLLGAVPQTADCNNLQYYGLQNPIQERLGLDDKQWELLVDYNNTLPRLLSLHKYFFIDGVYGTNGFDGEGYDLQGYNSEGYDREGYDFEGYNESGYNSEGFDKWGYDKDGVHFLDY